MACVFLCAAAAVRAEETGAIEFFEARVRPVLAEHCYKCHGPEKQKSGLRLDHISFIRTGGERGTAVVPGKPAESRIVEAVRYENPDLQMPPKKKLKEDQIATLEKWVEAGAAWPEEPVPSAGKAAGEKEPFDIEQRKREHWAWRPITATTPPKVRDDTWPVNDIDRHVLAKLDEAGLKPAPDADKHTWLRRVYFDLIGLPPSPTEVESFAGDGSPEAYARVVDGLLESPRFGERWARHWMDRVRYAETYGHEFDYTIAEAWRYRDYLIRALNADVPYDQIVREHLAGDLLEKPRLNPDQGFNESVIATGFWLLHEQTHAPTDVRQHESDRIDNQIDVMSKTFLGLTVACARCHDHKFDAISTKDYYALAGFLKSSRQQHALLDPGGAIGKRVESLRALKVKGDRLFAEASPHAGGAEAPGHEAGSFEDFSSGYKDWFVTGWAFGDGPTQPGAWGSASSPQGGAEPGVAHSGLLGEKLSGAMRSKTFTITEPSIHLRLAGKAGQVRIIIDGFTMDAFNGLLFNGLIVNVNTEGKFIWHTVQGDYGRYIGHRAHLEILDHGDGWVAVDEIRFGGKPGKNSGFEVQGSGPNPRQAELDAIAAQMREINEAMPYPMRVLAMADGAGEDSPVYLRGSHRSPGEVVPRRLLEAIGGGDQPAIEQGSGRLEWVERMLSNENPFPARVAANRLWHHLMGTGIVPTVDNFGVLGQAPSHPELLDYLAIQLRAGGWSQKAVIRRIVLSRTYRMSSSPSDEQAERADPTNTLLHRMNLKRLEGEAIRDAVLAVSGRLQEAMYGPPVAVHLTPFMEGRGRPGQSGPLDGDGRRSVYLEVRRNFLSPMMLAFDTPAPFTSFGRRSVSNVPAQALILMNDPFIVEQAGLWAKRVIAQSPAADAKGRIGWMYLTAFARPPLPEELAAGETFVRQQAMLYGSPVNRCMEHEQSWADLAHVLLNVKGFVFIQ